ncbi:MAG: helix-turn-helix domain-containing protein [Promethearchaeati archaeon SRVP18_Atabeyarchaeia-1]
MGGKSESSSSASSETNPILARLDKIAATLERLLEVSLELTERLHEISAVKTPTVRAVEERALVDSLPKGIDVSTLLDLPDHLRRPLMTIFKLGGRGTAAQVSDKLGVSRPQASATLNSLVRLNLLIKKREGKEGRRGADAIFMIPEEKQ